MNGMSGSLFVIPTEISSSAAKFQRRASPRLEFAIAHRETARNRKLERHFMAQRTKPPFRADHVGSLLRPPELIAAWKRFQAKEIDEAELKRIEHESVRGVVKLQ